jgi:hypothetical protein
MKIVDRYYPESRTYEYGITELDVIDGRQTYPYSDRAEAAAQLRLAKLKERGARNGGKFRDRAFENALKATDRI